MIFVWSEHYQVFLGRQKFLWEGGGIQQQPILSLPLDIRRRLNHMVVRRGT